MHTIWLLQLYQTCQSCSISKILSDGDHHLTNRHHALLCRLWCCPLNSLRPRRNGRYNADDIFKCIFLKENVYIPTKISLMFVPKGPIKNIPALVQIMAWRRPGDKPLSEPMLIFVPTHICVIRPQWVNWPWFHFTKDFLIVIKMEFTGELCSVCCEYIWDNLSSGISMCNYTTHDYMRSINNKRVYFSLFAFNMM